VSVGVENSTCQSPVFSSGERYAMKRAFTFVELLVVIGIVVVVCLMVLPAAVRAEGSPPVTCTGNIHELGLALANLRMDHDDRWNLGGCWMFDHACETLAIALDQGYIEDADTLVCPDRQTTEPRSPHFLKAGKPDDWMEKCHQPHPGGPPVRWWGIEEICYFFDEFRIDQNSGPKRAILADGIEMCTKYGPEPANHSTGSNVLFVDLAVQWSAKVSAAQRWVKSTGEYSVGMSNPHTFAGGATAGPWVRYGYIPNPRMSEDGLAEDLDDIYECEGTPPEEDPEKGSYGVADSADPDVANSFYSYAKARRCDTWQVWGTPSKTDCAVAGGACLGWWTTWRGGVGHYAYSEETPEATWYSDDGEGYDGLTWGIPEEFEEEIY
jgi:hypothetical protein